MLLKIGKTILNMDKINRFEDAKTYGDVPEIHAYLGYTIDGIENWIAFQGDEMIALRSYLDSMAVDVMAVYAEETERIRQNFLKGNKPECATCGDTGVTAIRNGDDSQDCPDCAKPNDHREIPY